MLDYLRILTLSIVALLMGQALPGDTNRVNENKDSLNICCVGNWSSKTAWTIAYDKARELLFLGSCGCVCILDVSDPSKPQKVGHHEMTTACHVFVTDNYAFFADLGLRIIDVSVPSQPKEVGYFDTPGVAYGVYVVGHHAYIADDWCGLRIMDISNPEYPEELGHLVTPGCAWGVHVVGSNAYVSACEADLRIIDITQPEEPNEVAYYDTPDEALYAYVSGNHVYVADTAKGLQIYAHSPAGRDR